MCLVILHFPRSLFLIIVPLFLSGGKSCFSPASAGSQLQTTLSTGSQGYKTNNRGLHVCIRVCACVKPVLPMDNSREGRVGGLVGEGGSESVRIAWWRTEPAVMAAYKWIYYITEAWSAAAARPRPAKANHQHSGKQPAHTSLPGAAPQTNCRNLRNLTWPRAVENLFFLWYVDKLGYLQFISCSSSSCVLGEMWLA